MRYDLEISLEEAALGCEKEISVTKLDKCETCHGSGAEARFKIKNVRDVRRTRAGFDVARDFQHRADVSALQRRGADSGKAVQSLPRQRQARAHFKNQTADSAGRGRRFASAFVGQRRGGFSRRAGRAICMSCCTSRHHEIFKRDGDDLICEVPVSFVQAALGAEIEVPTLEGKATIKIPAGTQPNATFRVKGKGVKNLQGYGHGDLHVRVQVEVPTRLNHEQKAKLQEFAALCDGKEAPLAQGFFEKAKKFFK